MNTSHSGLIPLLAALVLLASCTNASFQEEDLINDPFPDAQGELREAVASIGRDVMAADIEALQAIHLDSSKFTKFGPRSFERQDVASTNESEAAYVRSVSNLSYEVRDLKIDVFGKVAVVTYYPHASFVKDGEETQVSGRQTLVFLETASGWKIVHEHGTVKD